MPGKKFANRRRRQELQAFCRNHGLDDMAYKKAIVQLANLLKQQKTTATPAQSFTTIPIDQTIKDFAYGMFYQLNNPLHLYICLYNRIDLVLDIYKEWLQVSSQATEHYLRLKLTVLFTHEYFFDAFRIMQLSTKSICDSNTTIDTLPSASQHFKQDTPGITNAGTILPKLIALRSSKSHPLPTEDIRRVITAQRLILYCKTVNLDPIAYQHDFRMLQTIIIQILKNRQCCLLIGTPHAIAIKNLLAQRIRKTAFHTSKSTPNFTFALLLLIELIYTDLTEWKQALSLFTGGANLGYKLPPEAVEVFVQNRLLTLLTAKGFLSATHQQTLQKEASKQAAAANKLRTPVAQASTNIACLMTNPSRPKTNSSPICILDASFGGYDNSHF